MRVKIYVVDGSAVSYSDDIMSVAEMTEAVAKALHTETALVIVSTSGKTVVVPSPVLKNSLITIT